MGAKRKVEVFTAGCSVCDPVVELVKKRACPARVNFPVVAKASASTGVSYECLQE